jgi:hypothetical protein
VCDPETSRIGAPYIYDINHLRVKVVSVNNVKAWGGDIAPLYNIDGGWWSSSRPGHLTFQEIFSHVL